MTNKDKKNSSISLSLPKIQASQKMTSIKDSNNLKSSASLKAENLKQKVSDKNKDHKIHHLVKHKFGFLFCSKCDFKKYPRINYTSSLIKLDSDNPDFNSSVTIGFLIHVYGFSFDESIKIYNESIKKFYEGIA